MVNSDTKGGADSDTSDIDSISERSVDSDTSDINHDTEGIVRMSMWGKIGKNSSNFRRMWVGGYRGFWDAGDF